MTTQEKLIRRKQSLLQLAEYLQNISQVCKTYGISRQHFYDIKRIHEEHGLDGLKQRSQRKPCLKNRVAPEIEGAVVTIANEYLACMGKRAATNEVREKEALVPGRGVRSIKVPNG
jgi:transposase-like protein